jgi:hypothetical protein
LFFIFYFFIFLGGWVQLSSHGLGWAQPAQPGHWPKPVTRLGPCKWILIHLHSAKWKLNKLTPEKKKITYHSAARFVSFFPLCSWDSANGWFPWFWYLIDLLCSLRFSFVVFGCRSYEGTLPSLSSVQPAPVFPWVFYWVSGSRLSSPPVPSGSSSRPLCLRPFVFVF